MWSGSSDEREGTPDMKDQVEQERSRLQAMLDRAHAEGSYLRLMAKGDDAVDFGLVDSYLVTRVAPVFSANGDTRKVDFWLFWKNAGYDLGFQYAHTIKVVAWKQDDPWEIDLVDDQGERFHVEGLVPPEEPVYVAEWARWQKYKAGDLERFAEIDAALLDEHLRIAEEWEARA